jgi:acyl dehydratase
VADYAAVVGERVDRWQTHAPPSYAGALLFVVAPQFLADGEVRDYTRVLVHADQSFTWHRPLVVDAPIDVGATVERVRARGSVDFVTFRATAGDGDGILLESTSTFLLGADRGGDLPAERHEPPVAAGHVDEVAPAADHGARRRLAASRLDLVRYAAASGDFNPVHFDHDAGVAAGFGGVVVHGLLMAAWALREASIVSHRSDPAVSARFRFRNPLPPASVAELVTNDGPSDDGLELRSRLVDGSTELMTARIVVRR